MHDPQIILLIDEGEDLLRRMDRINSGDYDEKIHLREIQQWAEDARQWSSVTDAVIPEIGTKLDLAGGFADAAALGRALRGETPGSPVTEWEVSAYAYTRRLLDSLKRYRSKQLEATPIPSSPIPSKGHAFVSYIHEDSDVVLQMCDDLESYGALLWLDRNAIAPGVRWKQAIRRAVSNGAFFIACFSQALSTKERSYMYEELYLAIDELRQRPHDIAWFLPVKLSACNVPDLDIGPGATLKDIQFIELYADRNAGLRRIIDVIAPLPRYLGTWIDMLSSSKIKDRVAAAQELNNISDPRAMKSLIHALDDRSHPLIEYYAAKALGNISDPKAVPHLIRALKSNSQNDYKIAEILGSFDTNEALQAVKEYRKVENHPVAFDLWARKGMDPDEALKKSQQMGWGPNNN